jgi:hypothetical protein
MDGSFPTKVSSKFICLEVVSIYNTVDVGPVGPGDWKEETLSFTRQPT